MRSSKRLSSRGSSMTSEQVVVLILVLLVLAVVLTFIFNQRFSAKLRIFSFYTYNDTDVEIDVSTLPQDQVAKGCLANRVAWFGAKPIKGWLYNLFYETRPFFFFKDNGKLRQSKLFVGVKSANEMDLRVIDGPDTVVGKISGGVVTIDERAFTDDNIIPGYTSYSDLVRLNGAKVAGMFICKTDDQNAKDAEIIKQHNEGKVVASSYSATVRFNEDFDDFVTIYWSPVNNRAEMIISPNGKLIDKAFFNPQDLDVSKYPLLKKMILRDLDKLRGILTRVNSEGGSASKLENEVILLTRDSEGVEKIVEGTIIADNSLQMTFKSGKFLGVGGSDKIFVYWNPDKKRTEIYVSLGSVWSGDDYLIVQQALVSAAHVESYPEIKGAMNAEDYSLVLTFFDAKSIEELSKKIGGALKSGRVKITLSGGRTFDTLSESKILELLRNVAPRIK